MSKITIKYRGSRCTIELASALAVAVARSQESDNWCPLCECHPRDGHAYDCPLVQDSRSRGSLILGPEGKIMLGVPW